MDKTDERVAKLKSNGYTALSAQGGRFPIKPELREMMCLLSNGFFFVLKGQEGHIEVLQYKAWLDISGFKVERTISESVSLIRKCYELLSDTKTVGSNVLDALMPASVVQSDVVKLVVDAVVRKASDIHITRFANHATISYRIHGDLYQVQEPPAAKVGEMCAAIYQSMCDIAEPTYRPQIHQDARMKAEFVAKCGLFGARIASGPTAEGSLMVIRLLYDSGNAIPSLEDLGYLTEQIEMINVMRSKTSGINVLSGGTGSGKSTTLVSVMTAIVNDARKSGGAGKKVEGEHFEGVSAITIEDPPEYSITGVKQTPLVVSDRTSEESIRLGWANSIKACMRKDPDYLMIGEVRDPGSAKAAFDAAMTGHGVWTTVHVTDAVGIMMRMRGLQVESDLMLDPEVITGLINQSLVQRLCKHCSQRWLDVADAMEPRFRKRVEAYCDVQTVRLRGKGCQKCDFTGIRGRMVVAEVIIPTLEFMEVFQTQGKAKAKQHWIREMGGITKCMALIRRINEGLVDPREGEHSICPLDNERTTMGLDYSLNGSFVEGRERVRAFGGAERPANFDDEDDEPEELATAPAPMIPKHKTNE